MSIHESENVCWGITYGDRKLVQTLIGFGNLTKCVSEHFERQ